MMRAALRDAGQLVFVLHGHEDSENAENAEIISRFFVSRGTPTVTSPSVS